MIPSGQALKLARSRSHAEPYLSAWCSDAHCADLCPNHVAGVWLHNCKAPAQCLQAQKWLGIKDAAKVLESAPEDENFTKPRPVGLGLGAKYLPHHKVPIRSSSSASLIRSVFSSYRPMFKPSPVQSVPLAGRSPDGRRRATTGQEVEACSCC